MNIEKPLQSEKKEQEMDITNTTSFLEALKDGDHLTAEHFIDNIKDNRDQFSKYNDRWIDHREAELFRAYRDSGDYPSAQVVAEHSLKETSKRGRLANLKEVAGKLV